MNQSHPTLTPPDPRVDALMAFTQRPAVVFTRGRGSWLCDSEDRNQFGRRSPHRVTT